MMGLHGSLMRAKKKKKTRYLNLLRNDYSQRDIYSLSIYTTYHHISDDDVDKSYSKYIILFPLFF